MLPSLTRRPTSLFFVAMLALFAVAVACGPSQPDESGQTAEEGTTETEVPAETLGQTSEAENIEVELTVPTTTGAMTEPAPGVIEPVFSTGILPILERTCASCHTSGQAGSDHLELGSAADAVRNAAEMELQIQAGVMPPWPASSHSVPFVGDLSLSDPEMAAFSTWVAEGAPIDVPAETPIRPASALSYIQDPEIVMTSAAGPYAGSEGVSDDYRCLVFEPGNAEQQWILAAHFVPDQVEVVHHGIISLASTELRDQAKSLDDRDPGPGWTCYGGTGLLMNQGGSLQRMGGWAPGAQPTRQPDGYAIPLQPGDFFVVQIHYHYDDAVPPDLSQYVLDLASDDDLAAAGGSFKPLTGALYLGPAEIPCYDGDTDPLCDRDAAVDRNRSLYGDFIGALPNFFLFNCGAKVEDFAAMTDGTAWSTCDLPVSNPGRIVSLTGHMHELGLSIRLTLNPDTEDEQILLDIPNWDFEWQLSYRPGDDIVLEPDDIIRVDCAWNRERGPRPAVGYVLWSDGTNDEMCYSSITTAPAD